MFCNNCGNQIQDGLQFCTSCGVKLGAPIPAVQTPDNLGGQIIVKKSPFNLKFVIAGVAALVVVVLAFALIFGGNGASSPEGAVETLLDGFIDLDASEVVSVMPPMIGTDREDVEEMLDMMFDKAPDSELDVIEDAEYKIVNVQTILGNDLQYIIMGTGAMVDGDIEGAAKVKVTMFADGDSETDEITVIKVDGDWYVNFGDMSSMLDF